MGMILKALGDGSRLRLLNALSGGSLCVCQLIELVGLAPSTVSRHMSVLKAAGLVRSEKRGRWQHYRLSEGDSGFAAGIRDHVLDGLRGSSGFAGDDKRLDAIRECDLEELCRRTTTGHCG
ncbi:MAG: winged helix-turn-helix transcriptional regulator [Victivallales bacterium]|nr:winged helix-turn-helix transcriptional regulator [Victivallales bacterium]